jgi:hypothetical protein
MQLWIRTRKRIAARTVAQQAATIGHHRRELFISSDATSAWSFHDLILGHVADLGGADLLSEVQFSLISDRVRA